MDTTGHEWDWVQPQPPAADHAAGSTAEGVFEGLRVFDRGFGGTMKHTEGTKGIAARVE